MPAPWETNTIATPPWESSAPPWVDNKVLKPGQPVPINNQYGLGQFSYGSLIKDDPSKYDPYYGEPIAPPSPLEGSANNPFAGPTSRDIMESIHSGPGSRFIAGQMPPGYGKALVEQLTPANALMAPMLPGLLASKAIGASSIGMPCGRSMPFYLTA